MVWSYFGNGHGKGVHDGASATLKQEIKKEQMIMDGERLQNATYDVAFCEQIQNEQHVAYPNVRRDLIHYFHPMKIEDVDRRTSWDYKIIESCHSMHLVAFVSH